MKKVEIKALLDTQYQRINAEQFLQRDPLGLVYGFSKREDKEIAAFMAAILAWGRRDTIIANCQKLYACMDNDPYAFVMGFEDKDLQAISNFVHRTFNGTDAIFFMHALRQLYAEGGLEQSFEGPDMKARISSFHQRFFTLDYSPERTKKHVANPAKGSAAKRLNMFLRWMVRKDSLDLGLWKSIKPNELMCPLDVHVQRSALHLGLLKRKQADWKAVEELTTSLRSLDSDDPVKYDLSLFMLSESGMLA